MRLAVFVALALAGAVSAQCTQQAPPARVTVVYRAASPQPSVQYRLEVEVPAAQVWEVPSQKAYQLYVPVPVAAPVGRVEYRYGPFGRLRRVVVAP